jgi:DNA polymerase-1
VGPKTATKWLAEFGSLEGIIARSGELEPERFRALVAAAADRLRLNRRLTTLATNLPVDPAEKPSPRLAELCGILEEMEMSGTLAEARERYGQPQLF